VSSDKSSHASKTSLNKNAILRTDHVSLSEDAKQVLPNSSNDNESTSHATQSNELNVDEKRQVAELQRMDRDIRSAQQMRLSQGAGVVKSGVQYEFERGPDGALYVIGAKVSIDTSKAATPEETIKKMARAKAAANAGNASIEDRRIAANADAIAADAKQELAKKHHQEITKDILDSSESAAGPYSKSDAHLEASIGFQEAADSDPEADTPVENLLDFNK